ncbi:MAG: AhpC/TSA family protein [Deltaproteobacteria bacterium]|nr:AhpC/TSA family protein [Candidatus Zymogenaceae bacterium]
MKQIITAGMTAPDFTFNTPWKQNIRLSDVAGERRTYLIFLRYMGCPLCQMKISRLKSDWGRFREADLNVVVVLQSEPENITALVSEDEVPFYIACDPDEALFRLYGVATGSIFRYATPSVIKKAMRAKKMGFSHGKSEGKEMQLPAVFLLHTDMNVAYAYYGRNVGDVPENDDLLATASGA